MSGLTPKQQRFVQEYLKDLNATQAAIRAGYSAKTAEQQGPRLLGYAGVKAAITQGQKRLAEKADITVERIVAELSRLAFSNMQDYVGQQGGDAYVDLSNLTREQWAAVGEITVDRYTEGKGDEAREVKRTKFKLADKRSALVDLGKHLGMWPTRIEANVNLLDKLSDAKLDELITRLAAHVPPQEEPEQRTVN